MRILEINSDGSVIIRYEHSISHPAKLFMERPVWIDKESISKYKWAYEQPNPVILKGEQMEIIAKYIDSSEAIKHAKALHAEGKRNVFVIKNIDSNSYSVIIERPVNNSFVKVIQNENK